MPRDLRFESRPCDAQRAIMESLGFVAADEVENDLYADWRGHGVVLTIPRERVPTGKTVCSMVGNAREQKGVHKMRRYAWRLLGMRPLDSPVAFELLEMEAEKK